MIQSIENISPATDKAYGIDLKQQRRRRTFGAVLGVENTAFPEAIIDRMDPIRVLMQEKPKVFSVGAVYGYGENHSRIEQEIANKVNKIRAHALVCIQSWGFDGPHVRKARFRTADLPRRGKILFLYEGTMLPRYRGLEARATAQAYF